jgi:hypothetical protein
MTNDMILKAIQERRFDDIYEAGMMTAWVASYAYQHGYMTEQEMLCWADQILNL